MAVGAKEREAILNAIYVLRKRRVRPSGLKIAWYLRRENLVSEETTVEALDELVRSNDIMRVEYKGAISYRIANSKLKTTKPKLAVMDNHSVRKAIFDAIAECGATGGSRHRVAARLQANGYGRIVDRLDVILQRETRAGGIAKFTEIVDGKTVQMFATVKQFHQNHDRDPVSSDTDQTESPEKGNPAPFEHLHLQLKMLEKQKNGSRSESPDTLPKSDDSCYSTESSISFEGKCSPDSSLDRTPMDEPVRSLSKRGRPRKRKTLFSSDFSSNEIRDNVRKVKRYLKSSGSNDSREELTENSPNDDFCDKCQQVWGDSEYLNCDKCNMKAHPACLNYTSELAEKCRQSSWLCMECKVCTMCWMDHKLNTMIFCDKCDRAFHFICHSPPLKNYPDGHWICFFCHPENKDKCDGYLRSLFDDKEETCVIPKQATPVASDDIPDVKTWTTDQLVQWFNERGLEKYSYVFPEHEIDGIALLLMEKEQVLHNLGLKLGPAIKVYMEVKTLQCRTWNVEF